jgi:hypothetical protein
MINPAPKYTNPVMPVPDQVRDDGSGIQDLPGFRLSLARQNLGNLLPK